MDAFWIMTIGLAILGFISGMLGLGVAFAAVPFLALFLPDLVHQVQPLTLLLNGVTALFAAVAFARSGFIDWPKAIGLTVVATIIAPLGSLLAQYTNPAIIFGIYLAAVIFLAYTLFRPVKRDPNKVANYRLALLLTVPISLLAGLLGIGPGFLLMPALILVGFEAKHAAGMTALAVTLPSFSALIPHLSSAIWDPTLTITLVVVGSIASFLGARVTSLYVPPLRLKQLFGVVIVLMTVYRVITMI
jgi:uncharacterized membrane protein YfcA